MSPTPADVIAFWRQAGPERWYAKDDAFDAQIRDGFLGAHEAASRGELWDWEDTGEGALALLILLDQMPRNLYRGSAHAFATDAAALNVAGRALERGYDAQAFGFLRQFFYLPFMHAEDPGAQERCVALFASAGEGFENNLKFAILHRDIITRFGRFPHRNDALGRLTSADERLFLNAGGFAG